MQKCNLDMNLRILYYSSLMKMWGRREQKGMEVTEKQIRNLCSLLLWFMETWLYSESISRDGG